MVAEAEHSPTPRDSPCLAVLLCQAKAEDHPIFRRLSLPSDGGTRASIVVKGRYCPAASNGGYIGILERPHLPRWMSPRLRVP
jgi:hypothetical protein